MKDEEMIDIEELIEEMIDEKLNDEHIENINETFNFMENLFNNTMKELSISQDEIDKISKENGYYPAEKFEGKIFNKATHVMWIMEHHNESVKKLDEVKWHLSAMNKFIKDYKTFM